MPSRQEYTQEWLGEIPSSSRPGNLKTKCLLDKALKCPQNHLWNTSLILCLKHFVSRFYVTDKGYDSQMFQSKTKWYHFKEPKTKQSPRQICVTDSSKVTIFSKRHTHWTAPKGEKNSLLTNSFPINNIFVVGTRTKVHFLWHSGCIFDSGYPTT